jgi:hypothetical protein
MKMPDDRRMQVVVTSGDWYVKSARHPHPSDPIQSLHWPFDRENIPSKHPIRDSYSVEGTFLWAVGLFGTVENGAIVLTTVCSKQSNRPLLILVGFMSLADLYISMIYIPSYTYYLLETGINQTLSEQQILQDHHQHKDSSISFCVVSRWIFIELASVALSLKMLIAIYLLIYMHSRKMAAHVFSIRNLVVYVTFCWLGNAVILFLPIALGYKTLDLYPQTFICRGSDSSALNMSQTVNPMYRQAILAAHLVQLVVTCVCFALVHGAVMTGKTISLSKIRCQDKPVSYLRATKVTTTIFISLTLCWVSFIVKIHIL